jgi:predicted transcriptional regulator
MDTQNVTLALPKETLQKIKQLAAKRHTSISRLLTDTLEEMLAGQENYDRARDRQRMTLLKGFDLGTEGKITWKREDLHER